MKSNILLDSRYSDILYSDNYDNIRQVHEEIVQREYEMLVSHGKSTFDLFYWTWVSLSIVGFVLLLLCLSQDQRMKDVERELDFIDRKIEYMVGNGRKCSKKIDV